MFGKDFSCFSKSEVMKGVRIFLLKTEYLQQESWHVANSLNDNHEKETSQCKQIWFSEKKKKPNNDSKYKKWFQMYLKTNTLEAQKLLDVCLNGM